MTQQKNEADYRLSSAYKEGETFAAALTFYTEDDNAICLELSCPVCVAGPQAPLSRALQIFQKKGKLLRLHPAQFHFQLTKSSANALQKRQGMGGSCSSIWPPGASFQASQQSPESLGSPLLGSSPPRKLESAGGGNLNVLETCIIMIDARKDQRAI